MCILMYVRFLSLKEFLSEYRHFLKDTFVLFQSLFISQAVFFFEREKLGVL